MSETKKIRYQVRIVYETTKLYFVEAEDEEKAQEIADDRFDKGGPGDDPLDGWISVERYEIENKALACAQCGKPFLLDAQEVTTHVFEDGEPDYDENADHTAYGEEGGL